MRTSDGTRELCVEAPVRPRHFALLLVGLLLMSCQLFPLPPLRAQNRPEQNVFDNKANRASFPFELSQGEVIVPISIQGSRPLRFVLDSGSTRTLLDRQVAASLGLREGEEGSLQGAGKGRIPIHALQNVDLRMPGLESKGYDCFAVDLAPVGEAVGTREDGILGFNFFARFVITLDFEAKQMTIELPGAFHPRRGFEELSLKIQDKWAFVNGTLTFPDSISVQDSFFIDSGSSDAVDHPIVKTIQTKAATTTGVGLGTPVQGALAVATSFQIGRFIVRGPIVACCGATDATSRMIGTEILRRFTVIFDYPLNRLFLMANHAIDEPFGPITPESK
jgi:hypothetical protein